LYGVLCRFFEIGIIGARNAQAGFVGVPLKFADFVLRCAGIRNQ